MILNALRPYTTVIICEDGIKAFPFDVNHVLVQQYRHMGEGIDYGEVERFRKVLSEIIVEVYNQTPAAQRQPRLYVSEPAHPSRTGRGNAERRGDSGKIGSRSTWTV